MKNQIKIAGILCVLIAFGGCRKDFNEINSNPNGFTSASDGSLFNAIISSLQAGWDEQLYVNDEVIVPDIQLAAVPMIRWNNYTIGTENIWSSYYKVLPNFRELERRWKGIDTTSGEVQNMLAMEKILLAYKTLKVTDIFGDMPFSGAGYGFQTVAGFHPEFDTQESIYKSQLNELAWAADHIHPADTSKEPFKTFKVFDNLCGGDMLKWQKFANSLRMRHAMRMVNREPVLAGQIIKDIMDNHKPILGDDNGILMSDPHEETVALWPVNLFYKNESKGWAYNQAKEHRMGTTMWHQMSSTDSSDGSGIYDPRVYYYFETNINSKWKPFPIPTTGMANDGGAPYDYQRDVFYTLKGQDCMYSPVNYYLVRDMDNIPEVLISGSEVNFLRAEAYLLGIGVAQDAGMSSNAFLDGISFSLDFWQYVMSNSKLPVSGKPFSANITVPSQNWFFKIQQHLPSLFSGPQDASYIYAQSWIDFFWQPQQAWALARRTMKTPREGGGATQVYRFPIPPSEVAYNQANWSHAFSSGDLQTQKMWWMGQ